MVEQAEYELIRKLGKVEIRHYPRLVIAKVEGYGDDGFNVLFQFITGNNKQRSNVSMTAPVISEQRAMTAPVLSDAGSLAFIMPKNFSLETIPQPLDNRVKIEEIPERFVAALKFSGRWSNSTFNKKSQELVKELESTGAEIKGQVFSMRYNGPFTPWFLRRNEVAVEVEIES